jgi:enoyl-CoA hydratase/carnithine racemase
LVTLNRPDRLNAINDARMTRMHAVLDELDADLSLRPVLLENRTQVLAVFVGDIDDAMTQFRSAASGPT